ncbi:MAG TPA: bifunctional serine/threonine-protein kinase/formylglycine-generating enzyme family protein [Planctomycetaceae bacterium]
MTIRLERLSAEFENAWNRGESPRIEEYLPETGEERWAVLMALILVENRVRRWSDKPAKVEEYLSRFPELANDNDRIASLNRVFDLPATQPLRFEEYLARFPDFAKDAGKVADLRRAFGLCEPQDVKDRNAVTGPPAQQKTNRNVADASHPAAPASRAIPDSTVTLQPAGTMLPPGENGAAMVAEPPSDPLNVVGQVLDSRYSVTRYVGGGGMGHVYLARDDRFDRADDAVGQVAVKFMQHVASGKDGFRREAHLMRQFQHPNFVKVFDYGVTKTGLAWLVMEYLPGTTLERLLKQNQSRLPLDLIVKFVREVCTALASAHARRLVHRDLKPGNIMLVQEEEPAESCFKILDFGLSTRIDSSDTLQNDTMRCAGSPPYMSPEQCRGAASTPHSDIYSLGVILFELLTGQLPILGPTAYAFVYNHVNTPPRRFRDVAKELPYPPGVEQVVLRCLEKDVARRPAHVAEIQSLLLAELEPKPVLPDRPRTGPSWILGAALTAICLLLAVQQVWFRDRPSITPRDQGPAPVQATPAAPPTPAVVALEETLISIPTGKSEHVTFTWSGVQQGAEISFAREDAGADTIAIRMTPEKSHEESGRGQLEVSVPPGAPATTADIMISAIVQQDGDVIDRPPFHPLKVKVIWLPDGFTAAAKATVEAVEGKHYYSAIERRVDSENVKFVLVPTGTGVETKTFYIMENKVWRSLFKKFLESAEAEAISLDRRRAITEYFESQPESSRFPATNITAWEAYRCAKWLGGPAAANLPTREQWYHASGFDYWLNGQKLLPPKNWDATKWTAGPFIGKPNDHAGGLYDVGSHADQVSYCGCFDMAGNAAEFLNHGYLNSLDQGSRIDFEGVSEADDVTVDVTVSGKKDKTFERMNMKNALPPSQPINDPAANIGFRAVISPE